MDWTKPSLFSLPKVYDTRGNLTFTQSPDILPFGVERVYWLYDIPAEAERGGHAHRTNKEILVALAGSFAIELSDGFTTQRVTLNRPYQALYIPTGIWRVLNDFSSGAVCLVLASERYCAEEYIRDYDEFLHLASQKGPVICQK